MALDIMEASVTGAEWPDSVEKGRPILGERGELLSVALWLMNESIRSCCTCHGTWLGMPMRRLRSIES